MIEFIKSLFNRIKLELKYRKKMKENLEDDDPYIYK